MVMTFVAIGEFARMTHVNVKRLRRYHDTGVLPAARVDESTGFRYYDVSQAGDARLVARLRELDMPLPQIAELVAADEESRTRILSAHFDATRFRTEIACHIQPDVDVALNCSTDSLTHPRSP